MKTHESRGLSRTQDTGSGSVGTGNKEEMGEGMCGDFHI